MAAKKQKPTPIRIASLDDIPDGYFLNNPIQEPAPQDEIKKPERSFAALANDSVINAANSAVGLVKSGVDLFAPDSGISESMGEFIKSGKASQSDKQKYLDSQLEQNIAADAENDGTTMGQVLSEARKAGTYIKHGLTSDPAKLVSEAVGNIGPFAAVRKGMNALKLGSGLKTAVSRALSAGLGAGEVRGNIWEKINSTPDEALIQQSPEYAALRESGVPEVEAKQKIGAEISRNLPELLAVGAIGALSGKYGIEGMAAGVAPKMGRIASTAVGFGNEAFQGGVEQVASNYGVQRAIPSQSLAQDVGLNMAAEGMPGAVTGIAYGGNKPNAPMALSSYQQNTISPESPQIHPGITPPNAPIAQTVGTLPNKGALTRAANAIAPVATGPLTNAAKALTPEQADQIAMQLDKAAAEAGQGIPADVNPDTGEVGPSAYEVRQADAPKSEPGDILNAMNEPFKSQFSAKRIASQMGDGFQAFQIGPKQFVVRKVQPDVSTSAPIDSVDSGTGGQLGDNAAGSDSVRGRVPDNATEPGAQPAGEILGDGRHSD